MTWGGGGGRCEGRRSGGERWYRDLCGAGSRNFLKRTVRGCEGGGGWEKGGTWQSSAGGGGCWAVSGGPSIKGGGVELG